MILKALSSSCHILLVFMKVVFIHFPWLRWARSERPAPTNEEFLPAHQPLPITKFCSTVESRIPTANEGFADISRCLTPNERFSNRSSLIRGSEHQESWRKLPSLPPIQMMHYFVGCQIILEHPVFALGNQTGEKYTPEAGAKMLRQRVQTDERMRLKTSQVNT